MTGKWVDVAAADDIEEDDVLSVEIEATDIAVYNVDGTYYATEQTCTYCAITPIPTLRCST